jgi:hypothetical protein
MEPEGWLPYYKELAICPYPEPVESIQPTNLHAWAQNGPSSSGFSTRILSLLLFPPASVPNSIDV